MAEVCEHGFGPECLQCRALWEQDVAMCIVCFSAEQSVAIQPCGHSEFCRDCARRVSECPICRVKITRLGTKAEPVARKPTKPPVKAQAKAQAKARRSQPTIDAFFKPKRSRVTEE